MKFIYFSIFLLAALFGSLLQNSSQKQPVMSQNIVLPSITPVPTVVQPSEKALKIASILVLASNTDDRVQAKKTAGDESMTDKELVNFIAINLDSDPEMMNKALSELENISSQTDSTNQYSYQDNDNYSFTDTTTVRSNPVEPTPTPKIEVYGNNTTYTQIGNTTFGSDNSSYQRIGNTIFASDGSTYQKVGNTIFSNNGT
ncbi:MAG: hypothetical protein ACREHC_00130, partial [Candidatus Levyibacteriota bacterium]